MSPLATRILLSTLTVGAMTSAALAQVPPHGTVTELNPAVYIVTPTVAYSTANPNASFEWSIMHMGVTSPFDAQFLEISTPNSPPMTINMLTNTACVQQAPPIFKCLVQYPLSTADMANSTVTMTSRYYISKNGGSFERYDRHFAPISGTAGSTSSNTSGGGTTIPPISPIPPHTSIAADTSYNINVTSSLPNYSSSNNILPINLVITPNSPPGSITTPLTNELVEIKSPTGAVKSLNIASECTRSGVNNLTLTCSTSYVLPSADAAQPNLIFEGRYFANALYPNSQIWTGYSQGSTLLQGTPTTGGGTTVNCPTESNPMMPTNTNTNVNGSVFEFAQNVSDVCPNTFWIDPPIAIGYSYAVSGAKFESVTLPSLQTVADTNGYTLHYNLNGGQSIPVMPSNQHLFPNPVSQYQVKGIDHTLGLNLHDPTAFAMGVKLTNFSGQQVKITQIPMPLGTGVVLDNPPFNPRVRPREIGQVREIKVGPPTFEPVTIEPDQQIKKRVPQRISPNTIKSEQKKTVRQKK